MRSLPVLIATVVACLLATTAILPASAATHSKQSTGAADNLVILTDANWQQVLDGEWMIQFHAPWCPACRAMVDSWNDLARMSDQLGLKVAKADVTMSPALSGRFFITALPTILHVKNGDFRQYRGPRDANTLQKMIGDGHWHHMEPVSAWKHPNSVQMTVVAYFFRLSHTLKETNTYMQEQYKMPMWLTYTMFALVTITLGAVIGLMFVCIVDYIAPPRRKSFEELERDGDVHDFRPEDLDVDEPLTYETHEEIQDDDSSTSDEEKNSDEDELLDLERLAEEKKQRLIETKFKIIEGKVKVAPKAERIAKAEAKAAAEAEEEAAKAAAELARVNAAGAAQIEALTAAVATAAATAAAAVAAAASPAVAAIPAPAPAAATEQNVARKRKPRKAD